MPWKGERDPYKIWVSEIILQQTRVEQGTAYYLRFIEAFPTVKDLANAEDNTVFKMWEGLGYYSRCKNMIAAARFISYENGNIFPASYEEILKLKGVGPYTAAAISSFAFDLPQAVVDGNVVRVLARYFGIDEPAGSSSGKKIFSDLAANVLDKDEPALYNQAIMDLGATVCLPRNPLCSICPLKELCIAFNKNLISELPVKLQKQPLKKRYFYYVIAFYKDRVYVRQRTSKDIWQNLWEFIHFEKQSPITDNKIKSELVAQIFEKTKYSIINISEAYKQKLTHQLIETKFIEVKLNDQCEMTEYTLVNAGEMAKLAFPRSITSYFADRKSHLPVIDL